MFSVFDKLLQAFQGSFARTIDSSWNRILKFKSLTFKVIMVSIYSLGYSVWLGTPVLVNIIYIYNICTKKTCKVSTVTILTTLRNADMLIALVTGGDDGLDSN